MIPATVDEVVTIIGNLAQETEEFDAIEDVDVNMITLVDIDDVTPGANDQAIDQALEGSDPSALQALLEADPDIVTFFANAGVSIEDVVAIDVAENGSITIYYDDE